MPIPWAALETRREEIALAEALAAMKAGSVSASMVSMEKLAIKFLHTTNVATVGVSASWNVCICSVPSSELCLCK